MSFKSQKVVIFKFYAQTMPRKFLVDTTYIHMYVNSRQLRLSIFIYFDILVLISEFVVMTILSEWWLCISPEWWLLRTTYDQCTHTHTHAHTHTHFSTCKNKLIFLYLKTRHCKCYALSIMYIKLHKLSWIRN